MASWEPPRGQPAQVAVAVGGRDGLPGSGVGAVGGWAQFSFRCQPFFSCGIRWAGCPSPRSPLWLSQASCPGPCPWWGTVPVCRGASSLVPARRPERSLAGLESERSSVPRIGLLGTFSPGFQEWTPEWTVQTLRRRGPHGSSRDTTAPRCPGPRLAPPQVLAACPDTEVWAMVSSMARVGAEALSSPARPLWL